MGVLYDGSISGDGYSDFGPVSIYYYTVRFTTVPSTARPLGEAPGDRFLRAGWTSLGTNIDIGDGTVRWYWRNPYWHDLISNFRTPDPDFAAGAFNQWFCHGIRWHIESDGVAWLHVYGP